MAISPNGAVELLAEAANVPLPLMVVDAVQAVINAAHMLGVSFHEQQEEYLKLPLTASDPNEPSQTNVAPPVQYAVARATIDLKLSLAFDLSQREEVATGTSANVSARSGAFFNRFVKFSGSFATSTSRRQVNQFNLSGELVTTIHIEIAPVAQTSQPRALPPTS